MCIPFALRGKVLYQEQLEPNAPVGGCVDGNELELFIRAQEGYETMGNYVQCYQQQLILGQVGRGMLETTSGL